MVLGLTAAVLAGLADFLGGSFARTHPLALLVAVSQVVGLAATGLVAVLVAPPGATAVAILEALAAGTLSCLIIVGLYRSLALGTMGVVAPIFAASAIIPVVAGIAAGEQLSIAQLGGIVAAVAGIAIVSREPGHESAAVDHRTSVLLALATMVALGVELVLVDAAASGTDPSWVITIIRSVTTCFGIVWLTRSRAGRAAARSPRVIGMLAAIGLVDTGAFLAFAYATTQGLLSVVSVLISTAPVVTIVLAAAIHHEHLGRSQKLGAAVALIGVALVSAA